MPRKKVCFVSRRNICRSLIAEVLLRKQGRDYFEVQSFGFEPDRMHHLVREELEKRGLDPNYSFSKRYEVIDNQRYEYFVLLNEDLKERLPVIPYNGYELITWSFPEIDLASNDETKNRAEIGKLIDGMDKAVRSFVDTHK